MERRAHRQQHRPSRARRFRQFHRAIHRARVARNHDLVGRIQVRRADHFALRGLRQDRIQFALRQFQQRGHRAHARRHGLLHVLAAPRTKRTASANSGCPPPPAPSIRPGCGRPRNPARCPRARSTAKAAIETVSSAGCVFSVSLSPRPDLQNRVAKAEIRAPRRLPRKRGGFGKVSASALPMPAA